MHSPTILSILYRAFLRRTSHKYLQGVCTETERHFASSRTIWNEISVALVRQSGAQCLHSLPPTGVAHSTRTTGYASPQSAHTCCHLLPRVALSTHLAQDIVVFRHKVMSSCGQNLLKLCTRLSSVFIISSENNRKHEQPTYTHTPWSESARELYPPRDRRLSAK
jgi:hypothetical protein